MKYYEFGDKFEMYALIGTRNINEAIDTYLEHIYEDMDGELPEEITEEEAREKLLKLYDTEEQKGIAIEAFKMFSEENEPYLIIVDGDCDL